MKKENYTNKERIKQLEKAWGLKPPVVGEIEAMIKDTRKEAFLEGLRRHTWMENGITYVGNGIYTLSEAIEMAERDGLLSPLNPQE